MFVRSGEVRPALPCRAVGSSEISLCAQVYPNPNPIRDDQRDASDGSGGREDLKRFIDEDNHTALAGIRACRLAGTCETAKCILEACEARWAEGPLVRDVGGDADGQAGGHEWREMLVGTRESRK